MTEEINERPFRIAIAGKAVEIRPMHSYIREYCRGFLTEAEPLFSVETCQADIEFERIRSEEDDRVSGREIRQFSDGYLETLAVYRIIAEKMLRGDVLLFHGSALSLDGEGYLFAAPSGVGKSTHARLWREAFGDRVRMVNDDKPLLSFADGQAYVCGTPWNGKHRLSGPDCVPLKAVCFLERGAENQIREISREEALPYFISQSYRPGNPADMRTVLRLIDQISAGTGLYRLSCNMDPEAAYVSCSGMGGKVYEA